ncbi:hypothetical protein [Martelella endophytica]|uniref:Uncharacterized protein n=1 Tax=Martelella endophytica TaxID=1486262 RepID=A0A0D5LT55_MAREN|nr:hypothetical protein [Martelella endophytica]AJY47281.1 hypothetical protein TM49_18975 [Martelella endophytica]
MSLSVALWLFAVAVGPVLLGGAIAYGKYRERRYSRRERAESDASIERLYDEEGDEPNSTTPDRHQRKDQR